MKLLGLVFLVLLMAGPAAAQSSTPVPVPLPTQQMWEQMATAQALLNELPADLTNPGGLSVVPNEDGRQMFGYVKWLLSPASAEEWAGPLAPPFYHAGVGLWVGAGLLVVYSAVFLVGNLGGWIGWLLDAARKAVDILLQAIQAAPMLLILLLILVVVYVLVGQEAVNKWFENVFDSVLDWILNLARSLMGGL